MVLPLLRSPLVSCPWSCRFFSTVPFSVYFRDLARLMGCRGCVATSPHTLTHFSRHRLCLRHLHSETDGPVSHQVHAPVPDHGGKDIIIICLSLSLLLLLLNFVSFSYTFFKFSIILSIFSVVLSPPCCLLYPCRNVCLHNQYSLYGL